MRGMTHNDRIETATVRHAEGNKGEKIGVKRGFGAFDGAKLLKRQGENQNLREKTLSLKRRLSRSSRTVASSCDMLTLLFIVSFCFAIEPISRFVWVAQRYSACVRTTRIKPVEQSLQDTSPRGAKQVNPGRKSWVNWEADGVPEGRHRFSFQQRLLQAAEKVRFWVAQRFSAAIKALFPSAAFSRCGQTAI